eukprot:UN31672
MEKIINNFKNEYEIYPDIVSHNSYMTALTKIKNENFNSPLEYFRSLEKTYKVKPTYITFNILIKYYSELGDMDKCKELVQEMEQYDIQPSQSTYNSLLNAAAKNKDTEFGLSLT